MIDLLWLFATKLIGFVVHPLRTIGLFWDIGIIFIAFITDPWRRLFWCILYWYLALCGQIFMFAMKLLTAPIQLLTAVQREKLLNSQVQEMQTQAIVFTQKIRDLEHKLDSTMKDRKHIKDLLKEAEDEQANSMEKVHLLQVRVEELEVQNRALKAQLENKISKAIHDIAAEGKKQNGKVERHSSHTQLKDQGHANLGGSSVHKLSVYRVDQSALVNNETIYRWRGVALSSSIFSAFLTLLVGMIVWEAQDPCVPLVIALFIVVCMSLRIVVQFFLSIDNRPGFDAVALLSFNWFILGTLVSPTLPNVAQFIAPAGARFGYWIVGLFGMHPADERFKNS